MKKVVAVPQRSGKVPPPLSLAQQRLWFLHQLQPDDSAYNLPAAIKLDGKLDRKALERALQEIVNRHEVLRTTFSEWDDTPVQIIKPRLEISLPGVDLATLAQGRMEESHRLVAELASEPFNLAKGPLFNVRLQRLGPKRHVLMMSFDHIISDAWSVGIFMQELATLYTAFSAGKPSPLPELTMQYADFSTSQRKRLEEVEGTELEYWTEVLSPPPPALVLPTDHPRPAMRTSAGRSVELQFPEPLSVAVKELGRAQESTLFMTLLAAFQTLLHRYTGQTDVAVGTPVAGRQQLSVESLIGCFINTLVLRSDLSGDPSFLELLGRVRERALGAYAHQETPFEKLVEHLKPRRDLSRNPFFDVMFALQNVPMDQVDLSGLRFEPLEVGTEVSKFDLSLLLFEAAEGLEGTVEYDRELFAQSTIRRLVDHFETLLEGIVAAPYKALSELPLLDPAEAHRVLVEWNDRGSLVGEGCLHDGFEAQVERTPEAEAVVFHDRTLSYLELDRRANQLAHFLRERHGVGAETRVAICLERSAELIVAMLGVLKAGGAYVPLDPTYPRRRLSFSLADAEAALVVTREGLSEVLPPEVPTLSIDRDAAEIATAPEQRPEEVATARNLAYVIYTSGSTGRPKGVAIEHRSASHLVAWACQSFSREALSGVLASTSINFDLSVFETFVPLACGGTVIVAENALALAEMAENERSKVTLINTVPSAIAELVRLEALPAGARTVNLAGEPLRRSLVEKIYRTGWVDQVYNLYGPSEDTTYSTYIGVPRGDTAEPTLGRPLPGTRVYLLDSRLGPVVAGVAGELCLAGEGLARGYLRRPSLTARRFVPDRFDRDGGGRLYRTGDLARYRANGELQFLGRLDLQVKLRGFRIELGEIETVLSTCEGVKEAVVILRGDEPGEQLLAAYVVAREGSTPDAKVLRRELAEKLPEHMMPAAFVTLDALPMAPNGKVYRRALAARPSAELLVADRDSYVAPRTPTENALADLWAEILGRDQVSVVESFFDIGGHSLLAVRLLRRIERRFEAVLPLGTLFQHPTVERLAAVLEDRGHPVGGEPAALVSLKPKGSRPPLFWVHPVGGNVLCYRELSQGLDAEQPFHAFQSPGLDGWQPMLTTIEDMANHYLDQMRNVQPEGGFYLGGWSMGGVVAYEMARQLREQGEQVSLLTMLDSRVPTPKEKGPESPQMLLAAFAIDMGVPEAELVALSEESGNLTLSEQLKLLLERAKALHIVPPGVDQEHIRRLFKVFETNFRAMVAYRPRPYDGDVVLFKASEAMGPSAPTDPGLGWGDWVRGELTSITVPGNHYTVLRKPGLELLAKSLHSLVDESLERASLVRLGQASVTEAAGCSAAFTP